MALEPALLEELDALSRFDFSNHQQGIKIHKTASPEMIAAVRRLHEKGLTTQADGGYLTRLGLEVAEHLQATLTILTSATPAATPARQTETA